MVDDLAGADEDAVAEAEKPSRPTIKFKGKRPGRKTGLLSQTEKNRRRRRAWKRRRPRRQYHAPEQMRMAFLAGQGMSGEEIANAIGGTDGPKVRALLRHFGISMLRSSWHQAVIQIVCKKREYERIVGAADVLDADWKDFMMRIVLKAIDDPDLVDSLLAEGDHNG